ncbi:MAG TPA: PIG-L family deacetylase [Longimicrobiaceae bacterium]|nr:PIG-L family deacetylase [Longimicrobiaceae bacterium]
MWPEALRPLGGTGAASRPVLLVVAHPDDETIGAGALLPHLLDARILHLTDGAPLERRWWGDPSPGTREEYARLRRAELRAALTLAGFPDERVHSLGLVDQGASADLTRLARDLRDVIADLRPELVLTHPYEGGHPDHDASAFAVHTACGVLAIEGSRPPRIAEFTSYHAGRNGELVTGDFVEPRGGDVARIVLTTEERALKRRMLDCFASQRNTLAAFAVEVECFRPAPSYDFTRPPHPGELHYERFQWGVTGPEWRERASSALAELGLPAPRAGAPSD